MEKPSTVAVAAAAASAPHAKAAAPPPAVTAAPPPAVTAAPSEALVASISHAQRKTYAKPQATANIFSLAWFQWIFPLLRVGAKRPLEADDLFACYDEEGSKPCWNTFEPVWAQLQEEHRTTGRAPTLLRASILMYRVPLLIAAACFCFSIADGLLSPWFLRRLVSYISKLSLPNKPDAIEGYQWAIFMFVSAICGSLGRNHALHITVRVMMRIRSVLVQAIFRKSLKLDPRYRNDGEINNMMASDTQKLIDFALTLHNIWSAPIIIGIGVWEMYDQVGWSAFVCLGVLVLSLPVAGVLTKSGLKYQKAAAVETDKRVTTINEVMQGIRVIKYYAWEKPFIGRIDEQRERELEFLQKQALSRSLTFGIMFFTPILVTLLIFVTYSASGGTMDAARVFSTLSLVTIIRQPFMFLPIALGGLAQSLVAFARIEKFLSLPEIDTELVEKWDQIGVQLENAEFTWANKLPTGIPPAGGPGGPGGPRGPPGGKPGGAAAPAAGAAGAAASAPADPRPRLTKLDLTVKRGQLCMVLGPVGCGKSTLIQGILGEVQRTAGAVRVGGRIAYVPQSAFIVNASLRDNVLFGKPFNEVRYKQVIHACCLQSDIDLLANGDRTEIGERGINISGGQKQRISLARALYDSDSDLVLLDDSLSAVDMHVARHIFDNCINGLMKDRVRIFITNSLQFVQAADVIVLLKPSGHQDTYSVGAKGTYAELVANDPDFVQLLNTYRHGNTNGCAEADEDAADEDDDAAAAADNNGAATNGVRDADDDEDALADPVSQIHEANDADMAAATNGATAKANFLTKRAPSMPSAVRKGPSRSQKIQGANGSSGAVTTKPAAATTQERGALVEQEEREVGEVTWDLYLSYVRAGGSPLLYVLLPLFYIGVQALSSAADIWLADWSNEAGTPRERSTSHYLTTYGILMSCASIAVFGRSTSTTVFGIRSSRALHRNLLESVLRKSMTWFDRTPTGRIINRFTKDIFTIDVMLVMFGEFALASNISVLGVMAVIAYVLPIALIILAIAGIVYVMTLSYYRRTNRELQRLEALSRTPIFTHFAETLNGTATIRALHVEEMYIHENRFRLEENNRAFYYSRAAQFWLRMRLDLIGALILVVVSCLGVGSNDIDAGVSPGKFGLLISYALSLTGMLNMSAISMSQIEGCLNSAERVLFYSKPHGAEEQWDATDATEERSASKQWPSQGRVVVRNLDMRYRADLDLVLRQVNLDLPGGSRVGVVGRTGSGKSTLLVTLFRSVEPAAGYIEIDGVNTSKISLATLRGGLSIIPQDAIMFNGSLRYNLDPFHKHTDEEVWTALSYVQLDGVVSRLPSKLETQVAEAGSNLSVGQRQLLCLARALLRRSKVICLDEATANVDIETDEIIQKVIRTQFKGSTLITIAHRLNTILDYDYIVVMDKGRVAEFDSPAALRARPDGIFANMLAAASKQQESSSA